MKCLELKNILLQILVYLIPIFVITWLIVCHIYSMASSGEQKTDKENYIFEIIWT